MTGPWRYVLYGLVALALVAAIVAGVRSCKQIEQENDKALVNSGEVRERSRGQAEVINHVEQAKDARDNPTNADLERVCDKWDRNCHTGE